jgi:membrane-associated protease RseP (regulator of RpoE activity)
MSSLLPIWTISGYILPFVFVLSLLILFHELGHFLTRRELSFGHRDFDRRFLSHNGRAILSPVVESVAAGSSGEAAGVLPDDLIVSAGGTKIDSFAEMQRIVQAVGSRELTITVNRGGRLAGC